ncbi:MAG: glycoside hydrolase family 57 protein [Caldisericia bacterium]|nr:glycoside hydrolase family 57 protein [Caldisericia bacterium]
MNKIFLSFLWHFHQPYYKDLLDNFYLLPYTRIHLVKNYYMMAKIVEMNNIKMNFNFTPILLEQINDYEKNDVNDIFTLLIENNLDYLKENKEILFDKLKIYLSNNFIKNYSRLKEILQKNKEVLNENDLIDLIFYLNLSLIIEIEKDEKIKKLEEKKENYNLDDIFYLIEKENEIIKKVLPLYRDLLNNNLIELTMSPYAHPISPLIIDTDIAKKCGEKFLPDRFSYPDDLDGQIKLGKEIFYKNFNTYPQGIWPSEGAVSNEVVEFFVKNGFKYFLTDEDILFKTIKIKDRNKIYKKYFLEYNNEKIYVLFRDKILSDSIGFVYSQMNENEAVRDFIDKLQEIKKISNEDKFVFVILDGENPWEFYKNNGIDFLNLLYSELKRDKDIIIFKLSEIIDENNSEKLNYIESGSWINGDFKTWIGDEEDNLSWNYLKQVREDYETLEDEKKSNLKKILYIIEGSDWNWWYGKTYGDDIKKDFDLLYRRHIETFYYYSGIKRDFNLKSIIKKDNSKIILSVKNYITPNIDGKINDYFEWLNGFYYEGEEIFSSMNFDKKIIEFIRGGFDKDNLYLLVKINKNLKSFEILLNIEGKTNLQSITIFKDDFGLKIISDFKDIEAKFLDLLEIKIPLKNEFLSQNNLINFFLLLKINGKVISKLPQFGIFEINLDSKEFLKNWEA